MIGDYDATSFVDYCSHIDALAGTGYNPEQGKELGQKAMRITTLTLRYQIGMHACVSDRGATVVAT